MTDESFFGYLNEFKRSNRKIIPGSAGELAMELKGKKIPILESFVAGQLLEKM